MTENSLITLYCIVDDFIHRFLETSAGKKNLLLYYGRRGPKRRMQIADVVSLSHERSCKQGKIHERLVLRLQIAGDLHGRRYYYQTLLSTRQET